MFRVWNDSDDGNIEWTAWLHAERNHNQLQIETEIHEDPENKGIQYSKVFSSSKLVSDERALEALHA